MTSSRSDGMTLAHFGAKDSTLDLEPAGYCPSLLPVDFWEVATSEDP